MIEMKVLILHIVFVIENSFLIELNQVQVPLIFIKTEETPDFLAIFLSEIIAIVSFLDRFLAIDRIFGNSSSSYWPPSRRRSWSTSSPRRLSNNVRQNSFENHDHYNENFSKSKYRSEINTFTTEMTNAISGTIRFLYCIFILKTKLIQIHLRAWKPFLYWIALHLFHYLMYNPIWWSLKCSIFVIMINMIHEKRWLLKIILKLEKNIIFL